MIITKRKFRMNDDWVRMVLGQKHEWLGKGDELKKKEGKNQTENK